MEYNHIMEEKQSDLIAVAKVAKMFGVHPDTVRDWTEKGILKANRTFGGHRRYSLSEIQKLIEVQNERNTDRGVEKD